MLELINNLVLLPFTIFGFVLKYIVSGVIWFFTIQITWYLWTTYDVTSTTTSWVRERARAIKIWWRLKQLRKSQKKIDDDIDWENGI